MRNNRIITFISVSFCIGLLLASCSKEEGQQVIVNEQSSSAKEVKQFDIASPIVVPDNMAESFFGRPLTASDIQALDLDIDEDILSYVQLSFTNENPTSSVVTGKCAVDEFVSRSEKEQCCNTDAMSCTSGRHFRAHGCFDWIFETINLRMNHRYYVNNNFAVSINWLENDYTIGCNFYEPQAIVNTNGTVVGYVCTGPVFEFDCPATLRVETEWRYDVPTNNTMGSCGFNSEDFYWNGNPLICDDE